MKRYKLSREAAIADLRERLAAAEKDAGRLANLREAIVGACLEFEWYAARKKDLGAQIPALRAAELGRKDQTWADMLMDEIADLRAQTLAEPAIKAEEG